TPAPSTGTTTPPAAQTRQKVNINTATAAELDELPGIGKARAEAIIANRPFKKPDDLVTRKILSQSVYDGIKDRVAVK
ncbi:MAG TPA: helix-hairpin-helix domain-containing protein, partial [Stellaceae bacterium]|nr:helix-hairpin-helix domain-containing protein [Stellaceae bacterium]